MIRKLKFSGSHYEIGLQIGETQKNESGYPPQYPEEILRKSKPFEEQIRLHAPGFLDEFRGIADRLEIDCRIPLTLEATPFRFQTSSCFVMAISGEHTKSGKPVLARPHEWMEEDSKNLRLCYIEPDGKLSSLGFTFHWPLVSRYGGINETGLALSSTSATFNFSGPGIMLNLATRWVLDTCRTTQEAVAYLESMPKVWGETYVVIDKENTIAKVEAHRIKTKVTYTERGFDFNSLLYDSPEMEKYQSQEDLDRCLEFSSTRWEFMDMWFLQYKGNISAFKKT